MNCIFFGVLHLVIPMRSHDMFILELYTPLSCSQFGQTPLHIAAGSANYEIVKILVNANSDVKATSKVES